MTEIILARHGETEWNTAEIFRGQIDVTLNETGIKQAELLGEYLGQKKVEIIYSSPLKRALKTAESIASHHRLEVEIAPGLIDLNFGQWQGLTAKEVQERYKELHTDWMKAPHQVKIPEGERLDAVRQRALGVLDEAIAECEGTVIMVSHRVVNKVLICALLGLDNSHFWQIRQDNCGITTFTCENGQFVLTEHNNTSFLNPLQKKTLRDF